MEFYAPLGSIKADRDLCDSYALHLRKPTVEEEADLCLGQMNIIGIAIYSLDYASIKDDIVVYNSLPFEEW